MLFLGFYKKKSKIRIRKAKRNVRVCQEHSACRLGGPCRSGGGERKQQIGKRRRFRPRSLMLRLSISLPWLMTFSFWDSSSFFSFSPHNPMLLLLACYTTSFWEYSLLLFYSFTLLPFNVSPIGLFRWVGSSFLRFCCLKLRFYFLHSHLLTIPTSPMPYGGWW